MSRITIEDLEHCAELDRKALEHVAGGAAVPGDYKAAENPLSAPSNEIGISLFELPKNPQGQDCCE